MQFAFYFAVTALLSTFTMAYMGIFKKLKASYSKIGPLKIIFKQCSGDIDVVGSQIKKMEEITKKEFKYTDSFVIYYDSPSIVVDKTQIRSVIGIILTNFDAEGSKVERFANKHKEYIFKELPQVNGFKVSFPYRNTMSYIIGPKRAYSALNEQMQNLQDSEMDKYVGALEIVKPGNRRVLDFYFLIDESVTEGANSKYWLTNRPQPEYIRNGDSVEEDDVDGDEVEEDGEDEGEGEGEEQELDGEDDDEEEEEDGENDNEEIGESEEEDEEEHSALKNQNILENVLTESDKKKKQ